MPPVNNHQGRFIERSGDLKGVFQDIEGMGELLEYQ